MVTSNSAPTHDTPPSLGSSDPLALVRTRWELHHAAQLLASFAQAHVSVREDDSHRSLSWDRNSAAFRSEATSINTGTAFLPGHYFSAAPLAVGRG